MTNEQNRFTMLTAAYANFRAFTRSPANENTRIKFFDFLGLDEKSSFPFPFPNGWSDEVEKKVTWMSGPNAYTLFKVWSARNEEKSHDHSQ